MTTTHCRHIADVLVDFADGQLSKAESAKILIVCLSTAKQQLW